MTFSIVARCPRTGMLGVATASRALAAGGAVPHCRAGVGAIASQAFANPYLGIDGLSLLQQGLTAERALDRLIEADQGRDLRQVGIVDRDGRAAAHSGARCVPWAGHLLGGGYVCLGNILPGPEVVAAMARAFEAAQDDPLPQRLLSALDAGQEAGGDRRGRQSAGIRVVDIEEYPYCDLRVDDHPEPLAELRRLFELFQRELPFWQMMLPRRDDFIPHWQDVLRARDMLERSLAEAESGLPAGIEEV